MLGSIALICMGLFGVGVAVRAFVEGEISVLWSLLGGWGQLSSKHSRDESPVVFWGATLFYAGGGTLLSLFGVYRLV